jgi:hypothetical protein
MTGNGISLFAVTPKKTVIHPTGSMNYFQGGKQMGHEDGHSPQSGTIP